MRSKLRHRDVLALLARLILGGYFIYAGLNKALHPVDFLKLVREYELVEASGWLNFIAATLPWFEVFCGLLLISGIGVRGSALLLLCMLVPFTLVVLERAWGIHVADGTPFCAIRFDCGCGTGEVLICFKLAENALLILLGALVLFLHAPRWAVRYELLRGAREG